MAIRETAAVAAKVMSGGPEGNGGGPLSLIGFGGWALEAKHGSAAIVEPFAGCEGVHDVIVRLFHLNDATYLGLGLFVAILFASTFSLALGLYRLLRSLLPRQDRVQMPPAETEERVS